MNPGMQSAEVSLERLRSNPYPGRGIVVGVEATGNYLLQIYWIMGRSENSRNRVFGHVDGRRLFTEAADPSKVKDPSLIIYNAMDESCHGYVVSKGSQTDSVVEGLSVNVWFTRTMDSVQYEPDAPNFTPRITAVSFLNRPSKPALEMSILRKARWDDSCERFHFSFPSLPRGLGFCITTYLGDGDPLPSFGGEPFLVPLIGLTADEILDTYWGVLNEENRVAIAVKKINIATGVSTIKIINKYSKV